MAWFSKKEDTRYIKEFDDALTNLNALAKQFRESHFDSIDFFQKNFEKQKSPTDFQKERELFENHMEILQKIKFNADIMVDEALKLVRNETALTEKDRTELRKIMAPTPATRIQVKKR